MFFSCFLNVLCRPTDVRLCFMSDIALFIDWLYCIDLFSCIAASLFNKLFYFLSGLLRWLGSRVVSVLDSGVEGPGFKSQSTLSGNSLRQTVHAHCAPVHQAAKLVAALLSVAGMTAGLSESNGSLPPGLWLTSPAGWLPRTGISSGTLRSVIEYGLPLPVSDLLWQIDHD